MKSPMLVIFLFFTVVVTQAQIPLGFKAGININNIYVRPESGGEFDGPVTSFQAGIFTKIKIVNKLSVIPELQFIQKQAGSSASRYKLSYIELPILVSYRPVNFLAIEAGVSVGLIVHTNLVVDAFDQTDGGLLGGLQFYLTRKLSLSGRYYYGLLPIDKVVFTAGPTGPIFPNTFKFYNQNLQFSLHYYLK
jgi:hypothetical protein